VEVAVTLGVAVGERVLRRVMVEVALRVGVLVGEGVAVALGATTSGHCTR
jgi:hypothetical protein